MTETLLRYQIGMRDSICRRLAFGEKKGGEELIKIGRFYRFFGYEKKLIAQDRWLIV